ncbi:MAG: aminotransferase class I/II-fold pyridoxal phosphate-dependent enzyme [Chloroflexota bacterium]
MTAKPETTSVHGDEPLRETTSLAPPIYQTSTFIANSPEDFGVMSTELHHQRNYARYGNPNHEQVETVLAKLEGAESALVTGSGMGAFSTMMLTFLSAGDHVVAQRIHYGGVIGFLEKMAKFGIRITFVDQTDPQAFEDAITPDTKVILIESPSNPTMHLTDVAAVAAIGKKHGVLTICDNTYATPINMRPIDMGVDIVWHSATKYLGGHHDLIAGAIAASKAHIDTIWKMSISVGASLNGFDSWLLLRGMRTLQLRVEKHNDNALAVAHALEQHPAVTAVYYPGLASHPQHALAQQQMSGFTGMLAFEVDTDPASADRFIHELQYGMLAASLGGIHTLVARPAAMLAGVVTEDEFAARGVSSRMIRMSVGLEDADDLIADLHTNLDKLQQHQPQA